MNEGNQYRQLFADVYRFMQSQLPKGNNPDYWGAATAESFNLAQKYQGTRLEPFCNGLLSAILYELARG